ncbi:Suppressor/Enhancer of Lin12 family member (sel-10), putative [Acanthamoeba castellanii str. Neff]|uniref:Suppressor/Enhancer of Lin12 family member (Sel-10), putative n=1 Tax=Acanthamoeba castellanii (strain ATCC 30010 / Neff) TaxID=1257118 RepID=L8HEG1_ACACF|nr:Suppressor/Enhancer of Lin12 family member (sel-10), putative [Acanthamoeba castellanii str. Neff]ELR23148.1 Suppressor/Enhancer of Lin12 family member (sel-10), putative [Acanthamoeba castellanii str. Neff]
MHIRVWNWAGESRLFTLHNLDKENRRSEVRCLVFDRDAIVSGDSDFMVKIWDWNTGQPRRTLKGHQGYVKYVYVDDYKIVSSGGDGTIRVWDYRGTSDAPLYTIQAHTRDIINMDVHENAFASGSLDDSLKMWLIG